ncbi:hypothetical protein GWK47_049917 [Chionoecetes opilio]|uniref:Uncharacterized protein n=1 Tax=Chionoecetes opilio TaxID=41210 RepID=A0A8J4YEA6_CHIOP|nr:hypothetical protein GWK47_049917 [Chionoecetes opilio]
MRTSMLSTLVAFLACAVIQSVQDDPADGQKATSIDMLEVRKVNRPSAAYNQDHNVKIVLSQHQSLPTLSQWELTIVGKTPGKQNVYSVQAQDPYQTEVEFEADLTDAGYIYLEGRDSSNKLVSSYTQLDPSFLSSRVARVGAEYDESVSSLRVWPGDMSEVVVGQDRCPMGKPCYYISTTLPRDIPRCVPNYSRVKQCDDFITEFQELNEKPTLNITLDRMLTVQTVPKSIPTKMEVVVFNPQDPSKIFSPENYECQLQVNQGGIQCQQQLKDIGSLQELMVLIVFLNQEGFVLGSRMESYRSDPDSLLRNSTGVIVGSVVGVLGVALLAGAAVYLVKKKKICSKKHSSSQGAPSALYDAVSTHGPLDA